MDRGTFGPYRTPAIQGSPAAPDTAMLEPFVALANLAAHAATLLLDTGVTVLPRYQPLALAKQVASLDRVSDGRVLLGVGAGYFEPEFAAPLDAELVARYSDLGVTRLIVLAPGQSHDQQDELLKFLASTPQTLIA